MVVKSIGQNIWWKYHQKCNYWTKRLCWATIANVHLEFTCTNTNLFFNISQERLVQEEAEKWILLQNIVALSVSDIGKQAR